MRENYPETLQYVVSFFASFKSIVSVAWTNCSNDHEMHRHISKRFHVFFSFTCVDMRLSVFTNVAEPKEKHFDLLFCSIGFCSLLLSHVYTTLFIYIAFQHFSGRVTGKSSRYAMYLASILHFHHLCQRMKCISLNISFT